MDGSGQLAWGRPRLRRCPPPLAIPRSGPGEKNASHAFEIVSSFFFFHCIHRVWKFPGQGLNSCPSCDLHHSCGNARSLTRYATKELPHIVFFLSKTIGQRMCWGLACSPSLPLFPPSFLCAGTLSLSLSLSSLLLPGLPFAQLLTHFSKAATL